MLLGLRTSVTFCSVPKMFNVSPAFWGGPFKFVQTIAMHIDQYNLRNQLLSAGWNGSQVIDASVTLTAGYVIYSSTTAAWACDLRNAGGAFPAGSKVKFTIPSGSYVVGAGGTGGGGGSSSVNNAQVGGRGGDSMIFNCELTLVNNGLIASGGGLSLIHI